MVRFHIIAFLGASCYAFVALNGFTPLLPRFLGKRSSYVSGILCFFRQEVPPTAGQPVKEPMLLPVTVGLLGPDGADLPLSSVNGRPLAGPDGAAPTSTVLRVEQAEQTFTFDNIPARPVPSLLRNFSAPVRLTSDVTDEQLIFLLAHDSDPFNR